MRAADAPPRVSLGKNGKQMGNTPVACEWASGPFFVSGVRALNKDRIGSAQSGPATGSYWVRMARTNDRSGNEFARSADRITGTSGS
jgi:hypothetical protein